MKDAYNLPCIDKTLDCLNVSKIFISLDLKSRYWQVKLDEATKPLTTFTMGPLGLIECVYVPFGLTHAPTTFQHLMETCLGDLHLNGCILYLDDIIIFSRMAKEHITHLQGVLEKLAKAVLKLKLSKCEFFKTCFSFLGHIVSSKGNETDPSKIYRILKWPHP